MKRRLFDKGLVLNSDGEVNGVSSAAVGLHCIGPVDKSHNLFDPGMICGSHSTVMAAVTSLLSDGIHIGVLVRGRRLEMRTSQQLSITEWSIQAT
ncbi:hypothetical protein F2Q69_00014080 [Brassica cretica]|uniref:Uncharacterized protein n=1 Tax=Brassica cretica TaxID=69181 RepID=A0A8S9QZ22_BRACR|nr:hypothetical protein F2Q69_00014080 [Brassica cretica]